MFSPPAGIQDVLLTVRKPLDPVISGTSLILCQLTRRVPHVCCTATHWWQPNDSESCTCNPHGALVNSFREHDSSEMNHTGDRTGVCVCVSICQTEIFRLYIHESRSCINKRVPSCRFKLSFYWKTCYDLQVKLMRNVCCVRTCWFLDVL